MSIGDQAPNAPLARSNTTQSDSVAVNGSAVSAPASGGANIVTLTTPRAGVWKVTVISDITCALDGTIGLVGLLAGGVGVSGPYGVSALNIASANSPPSQNRYSVKATGWSGQLGAGAVIVASISKLGGGSVVANLGQTKLMIKQVG